MRGGQEEREPVVVVWKKGRGGRFYPVVVRVSGVETGGYRARSSRLVKNWQVQGGLEPGWQVQGWQVHG